jgi:putative redox protein
MSTPPAPASGVPMTAAIRGLSCEIHHGPSGTRIETVPPRDNGGTGASFSPTDLVGAALAACALSTMALVAQRQGLAWGDARAAVEKRMTPPPRRIGELVLVIDMPREVRREERPALEEAALTCPVARSLHPDVKLPIEFRYPAG